VRRHEGKPAGRRGAGGASVAESAGGEEQVALIWAPELPENRFEPSRGPKLNRFKARATRDARDASEMPGFRAAVLKVRIHSPSSGESDANLTSSPWRRHAAFAFTCSCNHGRERGKETPHDIASDLRLTSVPSPGRETCAGGR
jgi:hypothetical protein